MTYYFSRLLFSSLVLLSLVLLQTSAFASDFYGSQFKQFQKIEPTLTSTNTTRSFSRFSLNLVGNYLSGSIGLNDMDDVQFYSFGTPSTRGSYKTGYDNLVSLAFGQEVSNNRFELEFLHNQTKLEKLINQTGSVQDLAANSDITIQSLFANFYHDFGSSNFISPYAAVGVGISKIDLNEQFTGQFGSKNSVSYQFKLGATFSVNEKIDLFAGYRYLMTDNFILQSNTQELGFDGLSENIIEVGVRYNF